jgi:hypothetical protein
MVHKVLPISPEIGPAWLVDWIRSPPPDAAEIASAFQDFGRRLRTQKDAMILDIIAGTTSSGHPEGKEQ